MLSNLRIDGARMMTRLMASLCPTGMIFIPSVGGLSHNPKEFSDPSDIVSGVNILLQVVLDAANA